MRIKAVTEPLKYYRNMLRFPRYVEPPIGRRKARIECFGNGCTAPVIETRWLCPECWKRLPRFYKRALNKLYRRWKFYHQEGMHDMAASTADHWPPIAARCLKWNYERGVPA